MEATSVVGRAEEKPVLDQLRALVGEANVKVGTEAASPFLRPGQLAPGLVSVFPRNTEEVQAIIDLARKNEVPVVTCNDRTLLPEDLERNGFLLRFSRLDRIERIDTLNLVAHIERGVTWDQLNEALREHGIKAVAPVAANSPSVVECVTARVVGKAVSKFPDYALMNQKVVLADGSIQKTGAHTLSEECADGRHHDGGPALSTWFIGADRTRAYPRGAWS
jgi:FAD/FMN-containing dehydrogenase